MLDLLLFGQKTAPDFLWDARGGALPPGATFARGSSGWFFNSAGVLAQAGNNVARFAYEPSTLAPLGYLSEKQSTNSVLQSVDLSNLGSWSLQSVGVGGAKVTAPDGSTAGVQLQEGAAAASHGVYQSVGIAAGSYVGLSCFFKASTRSVGYLNMDYGGGEWATAVFNLSNGTVSQTATGATTGTIFGTPVIRNVGNGWYRCSMIAKAGTAQTGFVFLVGVSNVATGNTFNGGGEATYTGDGTSSIYAWGAQAENSGGGIVGVTSFIPTTTATVTRSADNLSLPLSAMPGWRPNAGGVFKVVYQINTVAPANDQDPIYVWDGVGQNLISPLAQSGTQSGVNFSGFLVRSGGAYQINIAGSPNPVPTPFVRRRQAYGWGPTRGVIASEGSLIAATSGSFVLPAGLTTAILGGSGGSLQGTLESVSYYAGQRSDALVQGLTS